ncbi:MAG TPA: TMEM175 family protein [Candidatus Nitrosotalea sp.]|nr:TMEM175 family protein [Candidatus Nitrosotalea sp.]
MNKNRFEAFTEGVFAFAFTLLAIGFVLPVVHKPNDQTVTAALVGLWPSFIAYALSLMVIGIMWQNHQALFRMVARIDRMTIFWNLLLLGGVAFIPFVTSTLGNYPTLHATTFLYGVTLSYTATVYNLMLNHLVRTRAFLPEIGEAVIAQTVRAYRTGWVGYVSATMVALVLPLGAFAAYVAIAIYYLIPRGLDADLDRARE